MPTTTPENESRREGRVALFGHESTSACVDLTCRDRRWRTVRAVRILMIGLVLTPAVAVVPPHAPWALGALAGTLYFAWKRFTERHTLLDVDVSCPRCGADLRIRGPTRLRNPHPLTCESCHHESRLHVEV